MERARLWRYHLRVSVRLRHRLRAGRTHRRLSRHEKRLRARDRRVVDRRDGACRCNGVRAWRRVAAEIRRNHLHRIGRRLHRRSFPPRPRRVRQLSGLAESCRRMVSAARAGAGHRHLQRGDQRWCPCHAAGRPVDHVLVRVAVGVCRDRGDRVRMARVMVADVPTSPIATLASRPPSALISG